MDCRNHMLVSMASFFYNAFNLVSFLGSTGKYNYGSEMKWSNFQKTCYAQLKQICI